jgi:hypothetical protein
VIESITPSSNSSNTIQNHSRIFSITSSTYTNSFSTAIISQEQASKNYSPHMEAEHNDPPSAKRSGDVELQTNSLIIETQRPCIPNRRIYGNDWINAYISSINSSRPMLPRITPSFSPNDSSTISIKWEHPYSYEHFEHQILENLHIELINREIEWINPLVFATKV